MKKKYDIERDMAYLELLAQSFPTVAAASTEIINLQAILNLPKGTEHFLADIHGEYEAFQHVLRNASGNIKRKVNDLFGNELREIEKQDLCTLIYYPEQKLELIKASEKNMNDWYHITLHKLIRVLRDVSSKYTRSKVRKSLPKDFSYIIQELLHERTDDANKSGYVSAIIDTIINIGRADEFVVAIAGVIHKLAIDQLHILGDIYDRGPGAHLIMDLMEQYNSWDIQWGNHDIVWMGACAGNDACICSVIRLSLRYANLTTLEEGYGINLVPLATFAMETYGNDPCLEFIPKYSAESSNMDEKTQRLTALMHKAIAILLLKKEAQLYEKHPEWNMQDRMLLNFIDYKKGTITLEGKKYKLSSNNFPTIDPKNPNQLTPEEELLMEKLHRSFIKCEKLQRHMRTILAHGCMYAISNNNLLFHASIPLNEDGTLKEVEVFGKKYKGKELLHQTGMLIRTAFQKGADPAEQAYAIDYFMYLWCGKDSPLFDKSKCPLSNAISLRTKRLSTKKKGSISNSETMKPFVSKSSMLLVSKEKTDISSTVTFPSML